jgi:Pheophorbide a oxygenase
MYIQRPEPWKAARVRLRVCVVCLHLLYRTHSCMFVEPSGVLSWQRPSMYHFRTKKQDSNSTFRTDLNIHIIPVQTGRSRVIFSINLFPWIPHWLRHAASNRFLNTDVWLHDAEFVARSRSSRNLEYTYASNSDLGVRAFRQWWSKHGFSTAPPNTFGPASKEDLTLLSRRELVDPWEHHSKQCSSCRRALKLMKQVQAGSLLAAVSSVVFLRNWPIRAVAVAAMGMYVNTMATKTATLIEGNPFPSGISDRSPAHEEDYEQVKPGQRLRTLLLGIGRK